MEVTAAVLYDGALAHYEVLISGDRECYAQLSNYNGNPSHKPPHTIKLRKEGRHWVSTDADRNLSDDLGYAVELKVKPLIDDRRRTGHPAG